MPPKQAAAKLPAAGKSVPGYLKPTAAIKSRENDVKFEYKDIKQSGAAMAVQNLTKMKAGSAAEARKQREAALALLRAELANAKTLHTLNSDQLQLLTKEDLAGFSAEQLRSLPPAMMAALSTAQLQGLSDAQVAALTVQHLAALSPEQISSLPASALASYNEKMLSQLQPEQRRRLEQLGGTTGAAGAGGKQLWVMTKEQLHSLQGADGSADSFMKEFNVRTIDAADLNALADGNVKASAQDKSTDRASENGTGASPSTEEPDPFMARRPRETFQQWKARMAAALRSRGRGRANQSPLPFLPAPPNEEPESSFVDEVVLSEDEELSEDGARGAPRPLRSQTSDVTESISGSGAAAGAAAGAAEAEAANEVIPEEIIIILVPTPHPIFVRPPSADAPTSPPPPPPVPPPQRQPSAGFSSSSFLPEDRRPSAQIEASPSSIGEVAWGRSAVLNMSRRESLASAISETDWQEEQGSGAGAGAGAPSGGLSTVRSIRPSGLGGDPDLDVIEEHIELSSWDADEVWQAVRDMKLRKGQGAVAGGMVNVSSTSEVRSGMDASMILREGSVGRRPPQPLPPPQQQGKLKAENHPEGARGPRGGETDDIEEEEDIQ